MRQWGKQVVRHTGCYYTRLGRAYTRHTTNRVITRTWRAWNDHAGNQCQTPSATVMPACAIGMSENYAVSLILHTVRDAQLGDHTACFGRFNAGLAAVISMVMSIKSTVMISV